MACQMQQTIHGRDIADNFFGQTYGFCPLPMLLPVAMDIDRIVLFLQGMATLLHKRVCGRMGVALRAVRKAWCLFGYAQPRLSFVADFSILLYWYTSIDSNNQLLVFVSLCVQHFPKKCYPVRSLTAKLGYFFLFFVRLPLLFFCRFPGSNNCWAMVKINGDGS